jgi:hypothetical protein
VAADAVLGVVHGGQELVADKDLFPCLQRRQFASSALTGAFFGLDLLLFYSQTP